MDKKLKLNAFLKGVSIFAFVAFCLLSILAGVTLPFVSNASTSYSAVVNAASDLHDSAVVSAESDSFNPLDFCIPLSECNTTDTYYGFYISQEFFEYVKKFNFADYSGLYAFCKYSINGLVNSKLYFIAGRDNNVSYIGFTDMQTNNAKLYESFYNWIYYSPYVLYNNGIKITSFEYDESFTGTLYVFTSFPFGKEYISNLGFESRFGYVGSLVSSNLFVNLQEKPLIPESVKQIKDTNGNFINGWMFNNNQYYLPLINAYDGFGNAVDGGFTGWHLVLDSSTTSKYNISFEVLNQSIFNLGSAIIDNGTLNVTYSPSNEYLVESNFTNSENLLVFSKLNNTYKYYLQSNISQNDVYKFFALIDYRNYKPSDNDLYVTGYNAAGDANFTNGYNIGFSEGERSGYNTGFTAGDSKGYRRGITDGSNYSFLSLFGAIFDAPIQALFGGSTKLPAGTVITDSNGKTITLTTDTTVNRGGMLNFNLMGVNLSGFVLALFSLSILVVVIKFALAKGR